MTRRALTAVLLLTPTVLASQPASGLAPAVRELGSIAPGKLADLVVIKGNPVTAPAEIRHVTLVFKDGVGYDSPKLLASVKGLVGIR
jgi:alpha-D-ribose 1-methylphosphonate 5-triphosphate diphosphatase PhnM